MLEKMSLYRKVFVLSLLVLLLILNGCAQEQSDPQPVSELEADHMTIYPSVTIIPPVLTIDRDLELTIAGAGFPPNAEVAVLYTSGSSVDPTSKGLTDMTFMLGDPVTDEFGAFRGSIILGRLADINSPEEVYTMWVTVDGVEVVVPLIYVEKE